MLKHRSTEEEIMDDLNISGQVVAQTLRELNVINRRLGGNQISVSAVRKMLRGKSKATIADLGCGGGDIMAEMSLALKKDGVEGKFTGFDANQHIVNYAIENTKDHPEISYKPVNIFSEEFKKQRFDVIHCCLFLHHFTDHQLVELFRQFNQQARIGVIVNDLQRHPLAYWSIYFLTQLFSKSAMVRNDAAVSVARGFHKKELVGILRRSGIMNFQLSWKWAFRWQLTFQTANLQK